MASTPQLDDASDSQDSFTKLRDILAALYPEAQDARIVVSDAGLDAKQIHFSSRAQTNWHNILNEARNQGKDIALLGIVQREYPKKLDLLRAASDYTITHYQLRDPTGNPDRNLALREKFSKARQLQLKGDLSRAYEICRQINAENPFYPDLYTAMREIEIEMRKAYVNSRGEVDRRLLKDLSYANSAAPWVDLLKSAQRASEGGSLCPLSVPRPVEDKIFSEDGRPTSGLPLERPSRAKDFRGHNEELYRMIACLCDFINHRVVILSGPAGIGKTTLAAEVIWTLAPANEPPIAFPDGIIFHNLYNEPQVASVFEHIARSFNEELKPTPLAAAQRALARRTVLLLLDGAENADDLRRILDGIGNIRYGRCKVLITSRSRQYSNAHDVKDYPVQALLPDEALKLLKDWSHQPTIDRRLAERIMEWVAGSPLALRLAGLFLATRSWAASEYYVDRLLHEMMMAEYPSVSNNILILLKFNLAQVSTQARQILSIVGLLALAPFDQTVITAVLGLSSPQDTQQALEELVDYGLLLHRAHMYVVTHELIHTYALQELSPPTKVINRLVAYYTKLGKKYKTDFDQLNSVRLHVMALIQACIKHEAWKAARALVRVIENYLNLEGYLSDRAIVHQARVTIARVLQGRKEEGIWLVKLGDTNIDLGQVEQAIEYYKQALTIAREIGNRHTESDALGKLGITYGNLGQVEEAISYTQQALTIAQEICDRQREGAVLAHLGSAYADLAQDQQAIECYQQALTISRETGDHQSEGAVLGNLGTIYTGLRQYQQAVEYQQQSLTIAQKISNRRGESAALSSLGLIYSYLGQDQQAIECHEQALLISRKIDDRWAEGQVLGNLGLAYINQGQYQWAIKYHQQALTISRVISDRQLEGITLAHLGLAYRRLGQIEQARRAWEQALSIFEEIKSPHTDIVQQWLSSV